MCYIGRAGFSGSETVPFLIVVPARAARTGRVTEVEMQIRKVVFKTGRAQDWTPERIERLATPEVQQLRENAERLGSEAVVAMCDAALQTRPKSGRRGAAPALPKNARHLVSRSKAFQARGVYLPEADSSWSGVRKSDGTVVMSLWAPAIVSEKGGCSQLLWAPNVNGSRPWSDTPGGRERLEHCRLALQRGGAEGLLVHGQCLDGEVAEHNARSVHGADPERVVLFKVEQRGAEYWAVWGAKNGEQPQ
jgi:hypothetical protein